jgi:hypothetical protein
LILAALRSILWYHYRGIAHYVVHGSQFAIGVILSLLGLLDLGGRTVNYSTSIAPNGTRLIDITLENVSPFFDLMSYVSIHADLC